MSEINPKKRKITVVDLILSAQNSVRTANSKMTMLNRTYPWGFVAFWSIFRMLVFFSHKTTEFIQKSCTNTRIFESRKWTPKKTKYPW